MTVLSFILAFCLLVACDYKENEMVETTQSYETEIVEESAEQSESKDEEVGDQRALVVGETGTFVTTLGTYEMTVESAEIVGTELDGEPSLFD